MFAAKFAPFSLIGLMTLCIDNEAHTTGGVRAACSGVLTSVSASLKCFKYSTIASGKCPQLGVRIFCHQQAAAQLHNP